MTRIALVALVVVATAANAQRVPLDKRTVTLLREGQLNGVRDVKALKDGRVFALGGGRVHAFDSQGAVIRRFDGNANFTATPLDDPVRLELTDSTLTVFDLGARREITLGFDGKRIASQAMPNANELETRRNLRGGTVLVERTPQVPPRFDSIPQGFALARTIGIQTGSAVNNLFSIRMDIAYFRPSHDSSGSAALHATPVATRFGAGGAWAVSGDSLIAHADGESSVVRWYRIEAHGVTIADSARFARSVRPVSAIDIADEAARLQRLIAARTPRGVSPSPNPATPQLLGAPPVWSTATKAFFSNDGALWVGVNRMYYDATVDNVVRIGDDNTWTVFPRTGNAFIVLLRPLFRLTAVVGDRLYGFVDDGKTQTIQIYSMRAP